MIDENVREITVFLNDGESLSAAQQSKFEKLVYNDLKRVASSRLASESSKGTLSATALVHEAFLRLDKTKHMSWKNRRHYFGAAAESMRRILIDKARYQQRQRREGSKSEISLDEGLVVEGISSSKLINLDDALADMEKHDTELADIIKLKYFAGLSATEIANLYESSERTISRRIVAGRAWLLTQLEST